MRVRIPFACLVLIAFCGTISLPALAQDAEPQTKPAMRPSFGWLLDLGVGQGYDDNAVGTGQGGSFTKFDPAVGLRQDRKHGFWSLNFQPSVQRFQSFSVGNRVNESASTIDSWQMSRRWTFDLNGNYTHTSDPFAATESAPEAQPVGQPAIVAPNNAFIGPEARYTVFGGSGTLHYQVRRHTELTFGGDYFSNRQNSPGLPKTTSYAVRAGYMKMVERGQSLGLLYSGQSFDVANPTENVTSHSLLLSYQFEWATGRQIALFAGPQYNLVQGKVTETIGTSSILAAVNEHTLGYAAGATFSVAVTRQNFFQILASHRATNGAGVSGAVIQDEGQLSFSRRFNERVSASVGGFYSEYQALGNLPVVVPNSWGASNGFNFDITRRSSISVNYDYFHQRLFSSSLAPLFSHNRVLVEYHYSFGNSPGPR